MLPWSIRRRSCFGRGVDQLDLIRLAQHPVRNPLPDLHPGDLLHRVGDALQVLDVHGRDHVDPGLEKLQHVLPALLVGPRARHVGMSELVDEGDLRVPGQHGAEVHLRERRAPVLHQPARDRLQAFSHLLGVEPAVRFDEPDHHVCSPLGSTPAFVEHGVGLAHAGRRPQIDPEVARRSHAVAGVGRDGYGPGQVTAGSFVRLAGVIAAFQAIYRVPQGQPAVLELRRALDMASGADFHPGYAARPEKSRLTTPVPSSQVTPVMPRSVPALGRGYDDVPGYRYPASGPGVDDFPDHGKAAPRVPGGRLPPAHCSFASASLSSSTTMYLLPRNPSCALCVCLETRDVNRAGEMPVALDTMGIWTMASWGVMSGS